MTGRAVGIGGRVLVGPAALALVLALAACSPADDPAPAGTTTTTSPPTATGSPTASPTASGAGFDCPAVASAQGALDDAFAAELSRLDIDRGDPRAQSVYALVTTTQGPAYYAAVRSAAPADLGGDAQTVLDYYRQLADRVGEVDPGDGSTEALTRAMAVVDEATAAVGDPAGSTVVAAQERLQVAVQEACSGASAQPGTATGSAGGATSAG